MLFLRHSHQYITTAIGGGFLSFTKIWADDAWDAYVYWQTQDKKTLHRINQLIKDIERNGNEGIGKPEPLKHKPGFWSRRIDDTNCLVYRIVNSSIEIAQCRFHYAD